MARLVHQNIEQLRVMAILFHIFVSVWPVFQMIMYSIVRTLSDCGTMRPFSSKKMKINTHGTVLLIKRILNFSIKRKIDIANAQPQNMYYRPKLTNENRCCVTEIYII